MICERKMWLLDLFRKNMKPIKNFKKTFCLSLYNYIGVCCVRRCPQRPAGVTGSELPKEGDGNRTQVLWKKSKQP